MITKEVKINTTKDKFFKHYLSIVSAFPPFSRLRKQELDLFNELLLMNQDLLSVEPELRWKIIFHYDSRRELETKMNINTANLNNLLTSLRKKKLIVNNQIPSMYLVNAEDTILNIKFTVGNK